MWLSSFGYGHLIPEWHAPQYFGKLGQPQMELQGSCDWRCGTCARPMFLGFWGGTSGMLLGEFPWDARIQLGHPDCSKTLPESMLVINNCMALGKPILRLPEVEWLHTHCDFHSGILQVQWLACPLPRRRLAPLLGMLVHRTGCWWGNLPFHASRKVYFLKNVHFTQLNGVSGK